MHRISPIPLLLALVALAACGASPEDEPGGPDAGGLPGDVTDYLDLPDEPFNYTDMDLPGSFETPAVTDRDNTPAANPTSDEGATLGRVLFYDTQLSQNNTVACASCHHQAAGFADPQPFSEGFEGGLTGRNSMGLANSRYYTGGFFWDERAATLEEQALMPIQDSVEMGLTLEELVAKVEARPYYPYLFEQAFGDPEVTSERISFAIAQFVRSIVSYQTRFDDGLAATGSLIEPFPNFTEEENQGKDIFFGPRGGCGVCHLANPPPMPGTPPPNQAIFFVNAPVNNGLDGDFNVDDNGVGDRTGNVEDNGRFKSGSLRNIALTAPYMHDGRLATLADVIRHYNDGVQDHPNLDPRLREMGPPPQPPRRLGLSPGEMAALEAFLHTLTDEALVSDPRFADPFLP